MDQVYNHKEASKYLGINERTLTKLILENEIPFTKKGKAKLYNFKDIETLKGDKTEITINKITMIGSPKGGTGKTATVKHAAHVLTDFNKTVLVIDGDPQHYFTTFASNGWSNSDKQKLKNEKNLLSLVKGEKKFNSVVSTFNEKIDFIAGLRKLEFYKEQLEDNVGKELKVKRALSPALSKYDHILIDTSPSQNDITIACLFACHQLIIPIDPEIDSLEAAIELVNTIKRIKEGELGDLFKLNTIYILPTKQKQGFGSSFSKTILEEIKSSFSDASDLLGLEIKILNPVLNHTNIPKENFEGLFKTDTKAYNNYKNSLKEVFQV